MGERPQSKTDQLMRSDWWRTSIIDMEPGVIRFFGYPVEQLIGNVSFAQMIWLMLRGEIPSPAQAKLLEIALVSSVDHGPQAPSIAIARMAATCGVGLNNAMASALNVLGDVHGGAGEQVVGILHAIAGGVARGESMESATMRVLSEHAAAHGKYIPGYGHRFHPVDPRAPRLLELVKAAVDEGIVSGQYRQIGLCVEKSLADQTRGKRVPMNIDGATAVIFAELGFPPPLARGLFCLSRSVGILAHAWEQSCQGGRNKGPVPRDELPAYTGPAPRPVPLSD
jgi:citrate synthase